ncbi:adenine phosphoribosyltransferase [Nocardioides sp. TF02-7]|uniref:adenine phosphoribosyltransferase n=1 Tax=Nocardioides sp. TF02-7 TaxID=2917724 RepID=UPI001F061CCA|nr:adenine phosphoribosyltransferase [Nocardioides sp. TF02-7]UMG92649.1 adenine phosphoribosyltransferase [Nocardioides sp. TF02-7]
MAAPDARSAVAEAGEVIARLVRDVPDFPEPGVVFKDITPLLADADGFRAVVAALAEPGRGHDGRPVVDKVAAIEARGFILGAPVALDLDVGFVPVRKQGKLPGETHAASYALEYGEATIEVHQDGILPGDRVLLVDDVLATGGTARAARELVERSGGEVVALAVLLELSFLSGRAVIEDLRLTSLATV